MQIAGFSPDRLPARAFLASMAVAEPQEGIGRNFQKQDLSMTDEARLPERVSGGFSFPRRQKLLKHADFQRVYKGGKRHFGGHLTFFYLPQRDRLAEGGPRLGLTVGRVLGGAVERNRIRRRVREAVRLHLGDLSVPMDVVINPKKSAGTVAFPQLQAEVIRAFQVIRRAAADRTGSNSKKLRTASNESGREKEGQ
ncbi:MAG TPA: ribonuclease P protein component [Terriglobales bacterium]|nr:ribonuclease P protein component [Terriglobales bacterium]